MRLTALGTGTSHGIPVAGCNCAVCKWSRDPHDKRMRTSLLVEGRGGEFVVIDTGPEFRLQCLSANLMKLDAVFYTHHHADHLHGLDDLRPFCVETLLPVYASAPTISDIRRRFAYILNTAQAGGGKLKLDLHDVTGPVSVGGLKLTPVPVSHGKLSIYGWKIEEAVDHTKRRPYNKAAKPRVRSAAWITDASSISGTSLAMLAGVNVLFLGALREQSHPTHFNFEQAFKVACALATDTYFIHICHEHSHTDIQKICKSLLDAKGIRNWTVAPAWDGISMTV